ncbi:hypothetical protein KVR01_010209 [Diaporthe batatas]|uniref:uncharacterized protein n=1 Tax=Diaporthe batatas TaxID=748121 RepID=UPI001D04F55B|nr:uncharacterized protein KVR01_010209 [Diaporthe batatas]KAG8159572.1 hypothetical protein KVR01_010209 [Diaporthe batatas]
MAHRNIMSSPSKMLNSSRGVLFVLIALLLLWGFHLGAYLDPSSSGGSTSLFDFKSKSAKSPLSAHVHTYFDQVFAAERPPDYAFTALKAACERTTWEEHNKNTFLRCDGINAGMTSIMSQVKVCFKMAIDAGVNMLLPDMPLRDSDDLLEFNLLNESAYMPFAKWFDQDHVLASMSRACPQMQIRQSKDAGTPEMQVKNEWRMDIGSAPGFQMLSGYFWVGRPFKSWFDGELAAMRFLSSVSSNEESAEGESTSELSRSTKAEDGATIVQIASQFLLFHLTDDPTGRDVALWNDLTHLIRFTETTRRLTNRILSHIDRPYYGVHFRTERDNIWSSFENQLKVDLDALDQAWERYGSPSREKPLVYLACGDEGQIEKFSEAAAHRGWIVTSKYDIAKDYPVTLKMIKDMPFDFQGAVDMGIMLESHFFLGLTGSAFSSSVANMRDPTGSSTLHQGNTAARPTGEYTYVVPPPTARWDSIAPDGAVD